jgi:hypothetical protein
MGLISLAITAVVIIAVVAVVHWFYTKSGVAIPRPVMICVYAIMAVIAIVFLARLAGVRY